MEQDTLSRDHPISEFIRNQKINMKDMTQEQFVEMYEAHLREAAEKKSGDKSDQGSSPENIRNIRGEADLPVSSPFQRERLTNIVLKFTTLSEAALEAPSFFVGTGGSRIGRDPSNEVNVPSDTRLAPHSHAVIEYSKGVFYLSDCGYDFAASVRIGVGGHKKRWVLDKGAQFSVGNSVFRSLGMDSNGDLCLDIIEGPLMGEQAFIRNDMPATVGRASDNTISVPDRELSRRHSKIEFDPDIGAFVVSDLGSTNGTYVQLVGPYGGRHRLNLNDHILVGRTGFSINRFDFGVSEEMGHRQTMEDACTIVQHLNMGPLCVRDLSPQSFFGVFDGHGGVEASYYLSQNLHINVAEGLLAVADELLLTLEEAGKLMADGDHGHSSADGNGSGNGYGGGNGRGGGEAKGGPPSSSSSSSSSLSPNSSSSADVWQSPEITSKIDKIVIDSLKQSFRKTDDEFIRKSEYPQHGSTATTALILGRRLYCANVGDSRTLLCRNFKAVAMSHDHKPSREDEAQRIRDAGGFVINNRVMGELAVSRAFGDSEFKKGVQCSSEDDGKQSDYKSSSTDDRDRDRDTKGVQGGDNISHVVSNMSVDDGPGSSGTGPGGAPGTGLSLKCTYPITDDMPWDQPLVIADPDIEVTTLTENDQFLLVACDGLFDVFSGTDIVNFVRSNMAEHGDAQRCCQNLTQEAIMKRHSRDNVSVILIILNRWY